MTKFLISLLFIIGTGVHSFANELDNESKISNQQLQGTVIVRVDSRDKSAAIVHTAVAFQNNDQAKVFALETNFKPLDATHVRTELDNDGGASSWYYHHHRNNYHNNNYFYWYGNYYQPCYSYNYGYYSYFYYTPYYWGW